MEEKTTISGRIQKMYQCSQWCDLEFNLVDSHTGKTVILPAHRLILASASPVFEALCFGPLAEKGTVCVEDIEPNVFEMLLKFLYTDKIKFRSVEVATEILYAAKKYMLSDLYDLSCKYLRENVTDSSCVHLFNLGYFIEDKDLVDLTLEHIKRRFDFVKEYIHRGNIRIELLEALAGSLISNCEEIDLVQLAQMWALQACESEKLEETVENVRSLLIKHNIYQNLRWTDLLNSDKRILPGLAPKDLKSDLPSRTPLPMKNVFVHRFVQSHMRTQRIPDAMTIRTEVIVSQTVLLEGVYINSKCTVQGISNRNIDLKYKENIILRISHLNVLLHSQNICKDVNYDNSFYVPLHNKIVLKKNCIYVIETNLLNSVLDYPCGTLFRTNKIVSVCINVECNDFYDLESPHIKKKDLGILTGFKFLY